MDNGYIIISRKLLNSRLWSLSPATNKIALFLLISANHRDNYFKGKKVMRGQSAYSKNSIAEKCRVNRKTVRRSLKKLEEIGFIKISYPFGKNQGQIISILNYSKYQNPEIYSKNSPDSVAPKIPNDVVNDVPNDMVNDVVINNNDKNEEEESVTHTLSDGRKKVEKPDGANFDYFPENDKNDVLPIGSPNTPKCTLDQAEMHLRQNFPNFTGDFNKIAVEFMDKTSAKQDGWKNIGFWPAAVRSYFRMVHNDDRFHSPDISDHSAAADKGKVREVQICLKHYCDEDFCPSAKILSPEKYLEHCRQYHKTRYCPVKMKIEDFCKQLKSEAKNKNGGEDMQSHVAAKPVTFYFCDVCWKLISDCECDIPAEKIIQYTDEHTQSVTLPAGSNFEKWKTEKTEEVMFCKKCGKRGRSLQDVNFCDCDGAAKEKAANWVRSRVLKNNKKQSGD